MNFGYKKLYINGSLQDSEQGSKQNVICPATGEKIALIAEAGKSDAIKAFLSPPFPAKAIPRSLPQT